MTPADERRSFDDKDQNAGKDTPPYANKPGQQMMGDGTEEQNLGQRGDPAKRIKEDEVRDAFGKGKGQGQQQR